LSFGDIREAQVVSELIRARSLSGYGDLVREQGADPGPLLQRFGVDPAAIDDDEAVLPLGSVIGLLEASADALSCPDFGLRLAQRQGMHILGPLALVAQNSDTVAEGFMSLGRLMSYYSAAIRVAIDGDPVPQLRRLTLSVVAQGHPRRRQAIELALGIMLGALRLMAGRGASAHRVLIRHAAVLPLRRYGDWFSCPVHFGQDGNALVVDAALLEQPIDQSNPQLRRIAEAHVEGIIAQRPMDVAGQVRALVERLLPTGRCTLKQVAGRLSIHERTLQRRLAADATRFDVLLDRIRRQQAEEYLAQQGISMAQVAGMIGFTEQSSFNRACRRWFGAVPGAVRRAALAGTPRR
jgi:AraC-like DNA-binding protein